MANMSYCRFHNTLIDLRDCYDALDDFDSLSGGELDSAIRLVKLAARIVEDFGDIAEEPA